MINRKQKALVHIYAETASLSDPEYRLILDRESGCLSVADPKFSQRDFDLVMAALEAELFARVRKKSVPSPLGCSKWVRDEYHWRRRLGPKGAITTRQAHKIEVLWAALQRSLPEEKRSIQYLSGMLRKATGKQQIGIDPLTAREADRLIDALRDSLTRCTRGVP